MARPTKQGMDYFPHDTDASSDEKVDALRMLYGNDGYAFYFIMLERIYRTPDFELDVSDAETIQILARKVEVSTDRFAEMLQTAIKRKCFCPKCYTERGVLTSPGIKKRAASVVNKRQKMAHSYQQRQEPTPIPASEGVSDAETIPETPVSAEFPSRVKGEERKVKESITTTTPLLREEPILAEQQTPIGQPDPAKTNISGDSYFHFCEQLKKEAQFTENTCMSLKIDRLTLPLMIDQFSQEQRALSKQYPDFIEFKKHCFNWLRIESNKPKQQYVGPRTTPNITPPGRNSGNSGSARAALGQGADLTGIVYVQESFK